MFYGWDSVRTSAVVAVVLVLALVDFRGLDLDGVVQLVVDIVVDDVAERQEHSKNNNSLKMVSFPPKNKIFPKIRFLHFLKNWLNFEAFFWLTQLILFLTRSSLFGGSYDDRVEDNFQNDVDFLLRSQRGLLVSPDPAFPSKWYPNEKLTKIRKKV